MSMSELTHAKLPDDFIGTIVRERNRIRPLLPQGLVYQQQLLCKNCGKDTYDDNRLDSGTSVRSPCDDSIHCDWCDYSDPDMRGMGLHVSMSEPHKQHPEFMDEWLKIHVDGIDFEWREENKPIP